MINEALEIRKEDIILRQTYLLGRCISLMDNLPLCYNEIKEDIKKEIEELI